VGSGVRSDKDQDHGGEDQDDRGAGECPGGSFQGGGLRVGSVLVMLRRAPPEQTARSAAPARSAVVWLHDDLAG
jgi:hypothetical protein